MPRPSQVFSRITPAPQLTRETKQRYYFLGINGMLHRSDRSTAVLRLVPPVIAFRLPYLFTSSITLLAPLLIAVLIYVIQILALQMLLVNGLFLLKKIAIFVLFVVPANDV